MCNRFRGLLDPQKIAGRFGVPLRVNAEPNPNVAPTDRVPIIRTSHSENRKVQIARFGLIPGWAKDVKVGVRF